MTRSLPASTVPCSKHPAPLRPACYRILNTAVSIESDSGEFLQLFHRDYGRFWVPEGMALPGKLAYRVRLLRGHGSLEINGERLFLEGHPNPASFAYQRVLRGLFQSFEEFVLLHAAVVAGERGAVVLAGPPGAGKTTLALALLERGFSFFSDDVCPLHRKTRLVHPFPRSAWVRVQEESAESVGQEERVPGLVRACASAEDPGALGGRRFSAEGDGRSGEGRHRAPRQNKALIAPHGLSGQVGGEPLRATHLFYLATAGEEECCGDVTLEVGLKEGSEPSFFHGLAAIHPEIRSERIHEAASAWRITCPARKGLSASLRAFLCGQKEAVWNVFRDDEVRPDFSRTPDITPLSVHETAFLLIRDLKHGGGDPAGRGPASSGRPGRLMLQVVELLQDTACFRLSPGRLDARLDRLLETRQEDTRRGTADRGGRDPSDGWKPGAKGSALHRRVVATGLGSGRSRPARGRTLEGRRGRGEEEEMA